jgi:hypothetical protein
MLLAIMIHGSVEVAGLIQAKLDGSSTVRVLDACQFLIDVGCQLLRDGRAMQRKGLFSGDLKTSRLDLEGLLQNDGWHDR